MPQVKREMLYSFGVYTLCAYDTAGRTGRDGLEGRRILNGPPRGGATAEAREPIQDVTGLEDGTGYKGIQSDWSRMAKTITDHTSEAGVLPEYIPSDRPLQALSAGKMTFWSVPKDVWDGEALQRLLAAPGSAPVEFTLEQMQSPRGNATIVTQPDGIFRTRGPVGGTCDKAAMDEALADLPMRSVPLTQLVAFGVGFGLVCLSGGQRPRPVETSV